MYKIGVDAMGGDIGIDMTVEASMAAIKKYNDIEIVLFGKEEEINKRLTDRTRISVVNCDDVMSMGEKDPITAVRKLRKTASMCVMMTAARNKEVDAVVTAGPTQCVVVGAHLLVKRLPGADRLALCPIIPNYDGRARLLLDVGANVELKPEHISDLATMANIVAKEVLHYSNPKVGLLNIGSEPGKGRPVDKETFTCLANNDKIDFYGNVEANLLLNSPTEIIITDGFTGNVAMKTVEGAAKNMTKMLKDEIKSSLGGKIGYLFMKKNLKRFAKRMDSKEIGGAMVLGATSNIIKAHGNSNSYAFCNAINQAREMIQKEIVSKVSKAIEKLGENDETI